MALVGKSLFLYGFTVTANNSSLDFKSSMGGLERRATLTLGFYSLTGLMIEIKRAMQEVDPLNTYTVTANRAIAGGTQNRVTISTSGAYLDLLFASGTRAASSCASLIGFLAVDRTGATTYTGSLSAGTVLLPNYFGYNYLPPELMRKNFGSLNVTASGVKEAIVYSTQFFFQVQFKEIPEATAINEWSPFMTWLISQRRVDFTPDVNAPNTFYDCTLETSSDDGKGLGFKLTEMLPSKPFYYDTGMMKFRLRNT